MTISLKARKPRTTLLMNNKRNRRETSMRMFLTKKYKQKMKSKVK